MEKAGEWKEGGRHLSAVVPKGDVLLIHHKGGAYSTPEHLVLLPATMGDFCTGIHHYSEHSRPPFFSLIASFPKFGKNTHQVYCINLL